MASQLSLPTQRDSETKKSFIINEQHVKNAAGSIKISYRYLEIAKNYFTNREKMCVKLNALF